MSLNIILFLYVYGPYIYGTLGLLLLSSWIYALSLLRQIANK